MRTAKHCENGDGPANFEGFGHVFCWKCYSRFMSYTLYGEPPQKEDKGEQQLFLKLDATPNKIVQ